MMGCARDVVLTGFEPAVSCLRGRRSLLADLQDYVK